MPGSAARETQVVRLRNSMGHNELVTDIETIGQRIKRERLKLGWTQRHLAEAVQVGVPHISKVESGRENPSDELLVKLAKKFKVESDELLLVARRVPDGLIDTLVADPEAALAFLRTFPKERRAR